MVSQTPLRRRRQIPGPAISAAPTRNTLVQSCREIAKPQTDPQSLSGMVP